MDWIKAHYDRVTVIVAALLLLVCSASIWRSATSFGDSFLAAQAAPAPKNPSPPGKASDLEVALKKTQQPPQWTFSGSSGLFVPEKHFIGADGMPATLKTKRVHEAVPNEWLEQFNLPITDADVLNQDEDQDGFTNLEEFLGHTNPIDKNSHPDYLTKLKLKAYKEDPFRLKFSSWVGDTFAINTIDLKQPTLFLKVGDLVTGTRFKIVKFTEKYEKNQYGTDIDVSELLLENEESKDQLTLVKEKVAISPESVATFVYTWGENREFEVRKEQEFSLKPQEEIKYKLIDVQPTKAVIVNTKKPNEPIEIGLVGP